MAAIPCATYQAGSVHTALRRRHQSAPDATRHTQTSAPLAGLASTAESTTSSSSGSPAMPSSPTVGGTFFGNFSLLSQKMKTLTDSWTNGINKQEQAPYSVPASQSSCNTNLPSTSITKQ